MKKVDNPEILDEESLSRNKTFENKKISKFVNITTSIILNTTLLALAGPDFISSTKILFNSYKSNDQITEDAKLFNADMKIAHYFGNNALLKSDYKRLPHNNEEPIYVNVDKNFSDNEKELINDSLNYYQNLFSSINPKYNFHLIDKPRAYLEKFLGKSVISINKSDTMNNLGVNKASTNLFSKNFISKTEISVKDLPENEMQTKKYVLNHELAHSFGIGDVYKTVVPINHSDTYMAGSSMAYKLGMLYPNDVAVLFSMYGENYRDKNNLIDTEVLKSLSSFESYKSSFYSKVKDELIKIYKYDENSLTDIDSEKIKNSYFYYNNNYIIYKIKFPTENKAIFSIFNTDEKLIYETETAYENRDGVIYLPSLNLEKGFYPDNNFNMYSPPTIQMMAILNQDNKYRFINMNGLTYQNLQLLEDTKNNQSKNSMVDVETEFPNLDFVDAVKL